MANSLVTGILLVVLATSASGLNSHHFKSQILTSQKGNRGSTWQKLTIVSIPQSDNQMLMLRANMVEGRGTIAIDQLSYTAEVCADRPPPTPTCNFTTDDMCGFHNEACFQDNGEWILKKDSLEVSGSGKAVAYSPWISGPVRCVYMLFLLQDVAAESQLEVVHITYNNGSISDLGCTFETGEGLCGWLVVEADRGVTWRCHKGAIPGYEKGPAFDKTTQSEQGTFVYVAPEGDPPTVGSKDRLVSLLSPPQRGQQLDVCLHFFIHSTGGVQNLPAVKVRMSGTTTVVTGGGSLGYIPEWSIAFTTIKCPQDCQILIQGKIDSD